VGVEDKTRVVAQLAAKHGKRLHQFLGRRIRNAADVPDLWRGLPQGLNALMCDLDADPTPVPSILELFSHGLSATTARSAGRKTMPWTYSSESAVTGRRPKRRHPFVGVLAAMLLFPPAAPGSTPQGADSKSQRPQTAPAAPQHPVGKAGLPRVTIEARKERQALRLKVDHFVTSVVIQPENESLMRWNAPICPLVAGLPRNIGEFMLARISQAARAARAPLAGRRCRANLLVIATAHPDRVLKEWRWLARTGRIDTREGIEPVWSFIKSREPVVVWYNTVAGCGGASPHFGAKSAAELNSAIGSAQPNASLGRSYCQNSIDTHLTYGDVRSIFSAIVVVDTNRLKHVTVGQLADYVSLVGLVNVRTHTDGGGAQTILRLFRDPKPPHGLTPWDRALLYSLYNTSQSGKLQLIDMEVTMVKRIAP
jgi:hypothetical protein